MRTLNEQIQRVKDALVTCYNAIKRKGGTIPEAGERTLLNMPAAVLSIPQIHGVMTELNVTANGEYLPSDYDADGFSKVTANLEGVEEAYDWLEERIKGSETVPAIQLHAPADNIHLAENLSVLGNRKITANQEIEDGTSLLRLVGSAVTNITTLDDTNIGWTNAVVSLNGFDNLRYVKLGAKNIMNPNIVHQSSTAFFNQTIESIEAPYLEFIGERIDSQYTYQYACYALARQINAEEIYFPNLKRIYNATGDGSTNLNNIPALGYLPNCKKIILPKLSDIQTCASAWLGKGTGTQCLANAPECLELITVIGGSTNRENAGETGYKFIVSPKLRKFVLGGVLAINNDHGLFDTTSTDLIHLELGGAECSLNMQKWNPTNALRTDTNADDYIDLREDTSFANNLEQFLYNFQTYIADRVADRTGTTALTLTLSPAVYAVLEAQEGQTILATLTNKNWNVAQ